MKKLQKINNKERRKFIFKLTSPQQLRFPETPHKKTQVEKDTCNNCRDLKDSVESNGFTAEYLEELLKRSNEHLSVEDIEDIEDIDERLLPELNLYYEQYIDSLNLNNPDAKKVEVLKAIRRLEPLSAKY